MPSVTHGGGPELGEDLGLGLLSQALHQVCTRAVPQEARPGPAAHSGYSGPSHLASIRAPGQDPVASADHISPTRPPGRPEATEEVRETPLPGSSNQGSLSESPSNPPPQLRPRHAPVPLVPKLGPASGASHLPHLHAGLGQVPRGDGTSLTQCLRGHQEAEGRDSRLHPMPILLSLRTWVRGQPPGASGTREKRLVQDKEHGLWCWIWIPVLALTPTNNGAKDALNLYFLKQLPACTVSLQAAAGGIL